MIWFEVCVCVCVCWCVYSSNSVASRADGSLVGLSLTLETDKAIVFLSMQLNVRTL